MRKVVIADHLSIGFHTAKKETVLHQDLNLHICEGELSCLLGPNGAGKSTLIKTLSGFIPALKGDALVNSTSIKALSNKALAKVLSVVLTDKISVSHITVQEVVAMGRYPHLSFLGKINQKDNDFIEKAMRQVGILSMQHRLFNELSDGEKQKVMIAKALAQDTPVIILDEPTAFLDFPSKIEVMRILQQLTRTANKAILLSTHDVELALQIADRIWLLDKDKPLVSGCPEDLVLNGSLSHFFEKKSVIFDIDRGTFRLKRDYHKRIVVEIEGVSRIWMINALDRIGFKAIDKKVDKPYLTIKMGDNRIILLISPQTKTRSFPNIESLIDYLKCY